MEGVAVHQGWSNRGPTLILHNNAIRMQASYIEADYVGHVEIITPHFTITAASFAPYPLRTSIARSPRAVLVRMRSNGLTSLGALTRGVHMYFTVQLDGS